jgi:chromatin remodeling complex protein RSC6
MVRTSKSDKQSATTTTTTTVPTTAPVENVVVSVSGEKAASKPRAKKVKEVVVSLETVSVAPVVVSETTASVTPVVEAKSTLEVTEPSIMIKLNEFSAKLQQMAGLFATVRSDFKTMEKVVSREIKNAQKASSKKKKSSGNRKPSGFVKPTLISPELAQFLGKTVGTEMARTEVSREINAYIRAQGLQDKANGRKINPDSSLTKLLNLQSEDELTYFNLQKYMKHHFIKTVVPEAVTATA